jgi:hypothetical protein
MVSSTINDAVRDAEHSDSCNANLMSRFESCAQFDTDGCDCNTELDAVQALHDVAQAPDELLQHWKAIEDAVYHQGRDEVLMFDRASAIRIIMHLSAELGAEECWAGAATLLDAFLLIVGHNNITETILVAVVLLRWKQNNKPESSFRVAEAGKRFITISSHLKEQVEAASIKEQIHIAELQVLYVLNWRSFLPSVVDWSMVILARFSALSAIQVPGFKGEIQASAPIVKLWAEALVIHVGSSIRMRPSEMAIGACAVGLVCGGVLPADTLRAEAFASLQRFLAEEFHHFQKDLTKDSHMEDSHMQELQRMHLGVLAHAACCNTNRLQAGTTMVTESLVTRLLRN